MSDKNRINMAVLLSAMVALGACSNVEATPAEPPPAVVEEVSGDVLPRITLTASAADRLGIEMDKVAVAEQGFVVPSAAVIITTEGRYWVYTNPEPLVYLREEISPVFEEDEQAFFSDGPPVGMPVVITGVPELYGAEFGVGK